MAKSLTNEISVDEIYNRFSSEDLCIEYLEKAGWGDTPTCARCGCVDVKRHPT